MLKIMTLGTGHVGFLSTYTRPLRYSLKSIAAINFLKRIILSHWVHSGGKVFHSIAILIMKSCFLISSRNLSTFSKILFEVRVFFGGLEIVKKFSKDGTNPCNILKVSSKSLMSLVSSNLFRPRTLSLSSYDRFPVHNKFFVNFL